jgi:endoglucanase
MSRLALAAVVLTISAVATATTSAWSQSEPSNDDAFALCRSIGRGINLGNGLEAPSEGAWGYRIEDDHLRQIKQAGFNSVRIPIRWSAHAQNDPPYAIHSEFFARVDHVVGAAARNNLVVVINVHHYDELYRNPDAHLERLAALWQQIAEHYQNRPSSMLFELLNEPNDKLDEKRWNEVIARLLPIVRKTNPQRGVIVGPARWNNIHALSTLELPEADRHLIATIHYYEPFQFTHQGASWAKGSNEWLGRKWAGSAEELQRLHSDFDKAAAWGKQHGRPIFLGEFGAYSAADLQSRARWTAAVVQAALKRDFSFAYWEFGSGFGAYNSRAKQWRTPLLNALISTER